MNGGYGLMTSCHPRLLSSINGSKQKASSDTRTWIPTSVEILQLHFNFFAVLNHRNMTDYLKLTVKLSNFDILRFYDDIMRKLDLQHTYNFNIRAKKTALFENHALAQVCRRTKAVSYKSASSFSRCLTHPLPSSVSISHVTHELPSNLQHPISLCLQTKQPCSPSTLLHPSLQL